jgi:Protein of unknown function (DUF3788)
MSEELTPNAFIGRTTPPADDDLTAALGSTRPLWDQALATLANRFGLAEWEWMSYSAKAGWSVRIKKGKRNILYMTPCRNTFRLAFILGGKAVQAAQETKTPARVLKMIQSGTKYPEGLGIRWEIKSVEDLAPVETLTALKLAH